MARPTKFKKAFIKEGEKFAMIAVPQKDMAFFWGVSEDSISRWKKLNIEGFADAIKKGEAHRKINLLTSMYNAAIGTRTRAPNIIMQIFLAKNWLNYSDRQDLSLAGKEGLPLRIIIEKEGGKSDRRGSKS